MRAGDLGDLCIFASIDIVQPDQPCAYQRRGHRVLYRRDRALAIAISYSELDDECPRGRGGDLLPFLHGAHDTA